MKSTIKINSDFSFYYPFETSIFKTNSDKNIYHTLRHSLTCRQLSYNPIEQLYFDSQRLFRLSLKKYDSDPLTASYLYELAIFKYKEYSSRAVTYKKDSL